MMRGLPGQIETEVPWAGSLAVGALVDVTATMSGLGSACTFAQQGTTTVSVGTVRGAAAPGSAVFYTQVTQAKYHYVFVVAIGG